MHPLNRYGSRDLITLHYTKFSFASAADTDYDGIKAKHNSAHLKDRSPARFWLGDLPHLAPTSPPFQPPIDRCQRSPEHRGTDYPHNGHRSPEECVDLVHLSPRNRARRNTGGETKSVHGFNDYHGAEDAVKITRCLKRPHKDEPYSRAGHKHRSLSPSTEYAGHDLLGQANLKHRQNAARRSSPISRLPTIPQNSSLFGASSATVSRSDSYMSTLLVPPSKSGADVSGHRAPTGLSFEKVYPATAQSHHTITQLLNLTLPGSVLHNLVEGRETSGGSHLGLAEAHKVSAAKLQDTHQRRCCHSRPRKFDTAEKLAAHEAEKKYGCNYCSSRFGKNEAKRHQQSFHNRHQSWSCSALSDYKQAFHESTNRPGAADICGYCGWEFPRNGTLNQNPVSRDTTDQDWADRLHHWREAHKWRRCSFDKKFHRADNMRQHIRRCHNGTRGEWTNKLEDACRQDEPRVDSGNCAAEF